LRAWAKAKFVRKRIAIDNNIFIIYRFRPLS